MTVPSRTMEPTIPSGSSIIVDLNAYHKKKPARFDIVTFVPPDERINIYVLRIIGLPGESIKLDQDGVLVNGERLTLPVGVVITSSQQQLNPISNVRLSAGEYWLLGDNTKLARDSRFFGSVPLNDIIGKVIEINFPSKGD